MLAVSSTFAILNTQTKFFKKTETVTSEQKVSEFKNKWVYDFSGDVDADQYYPVVCLRTGYKILRDDGNSYLVGWKYDLINTTGSNREINVTYKLIDGDDFVVVQGKGVKYVKGKSIDTIQDAFVISKKDYSRIYSSTWTINVGAYDSASMKKNNFSKYGEAWKVIDQTNNYRHEWIKNYIKYMVNKQLYNDNVTDLYSVLYGEKWVALIKKSGIKKDKNLMDTLVSLDVGENHVPSKETIQGKEIYQKLDFDTRMKVDAWLEWQSEFRKW